MMKCKSCVKVRNGIERATIIIYMYMIKYEVNPLFKILDSSEAQSRHLYYVLINGVHEYFSRLSLLSVIRNNGS